MANIGNIQRTTATQTTQTAVERNGQTQQARSNRQESLTVSKQQADRVTISQQGQQRLQAESNINRSNANARTQQANTQTQVDAQRTVERRRNAEATENQAQQRRIDQAAQAPVKAPTPPEPNKGNNIDVRA
ncbi:hypothetical protein SAMN02745857_03096 [Andreprevotia lacus DSM 23236]|jgi:septal ring factor EnvC (AmiA/AmiB activator)|uniref:Uncharacterized protein n=1 Tax=Andreprevotia lacus DSM 23236 TaxID=1121001 RepID=A0A1W1XVW4_9NEIS|nr:hypothetical protein [Andreprevotia lacus]SMC28066.1 hypothetical protein SAMN02745857_03096 [Andreprevotia lacus DSM 23236]